MRFLIVFKVFYLLIFHKPFLSWQGTHSLCISVEFWFILQCNNAFNCCEPVLGCRAGWFPDNGNKGMDLWDPEHQFLVPGVMLPGGVNHTGVCKDHLDPPSIPWSALGIAFSKTLKWELIPQSSRSKWEQRINIPRVLGEDGEPSVSLHVPSLLLTQHWDLEVCVPQTNPIPNWNNWFLLFSPPFQWQK